MYNLDIIKVVTTSLIHYGITLIYAILIFLIGLFLAKFFRRVCAKVFNVRKVDPTITLFISQLLYYVILSFSIIAALSKMGIPTASLIAVLGAAGLAIAFSLRSSLSNLASGILLIVFRPFKVGDSILVASENGTVKEISILYTKLVTGQNLEVIIPNTKFMGSIVTNYSTNSLRRAEITVGIGYDDSIKDAKKLLEKLMDKDKRIVEKPTPYIGVNALADSSVNLFIRAKVKREDYWQFIFDMNEAIKNSFDKAGISIPYPQQDIHLIKSATDVSKQTG